MNVQSELTEFLKVSRRGEEAEQVYLRRVFDKVNALDDVEWKKLSEPTQKWVNDASKALEDGDDIPSLGNGADTGNGEAKPEKKAKAAKAPKKAVEAKTEKKAKEAKAPVKKAASAPAKAAKKAAKAPAKAKSAKAEAKAKPAKKAAAKAGVKKRAASEPREGTKTALIVGLLTRAKGCTAADILEATGWPTVSVPEQARKAGLKLSKEKRGRTTHYRAK